MTVSPFHHTVTTWLRRSISFSVIFLLWSAVTAGLPLWLAFCLLSDGLAKSRRFAKTRCLMFFVLFLNAEILGLAGSLGVWLVHRCLPANSERPLEWNQKLQEWWTTALLRGAMKIFSMKLAVEGADQLLPGPIVVFIRHSSSADTVLPSVLITAGHGIRLRFVLKKELLWDPCLDVVGNRLPNVFIDRSGRQTAEELGAIGELVRHTGPREGVLIYPEGTRFSEAKRRRYVDRLANTAPPGLARTAARYRHVLPPRPGGAMAVMAAAPDTAVVFCMHTGMEGSASFRKFWNGGLIGKTIRVAFRRVAPDAIPIPPEARLQWLYDRWLEVDDWIDAHRQ
jgi:1-acyl-sn-glycerol-3-phosphate acyltransferase